MKTKILSLALALMMIISVAAALPVSAEVAPINVDLFNLITGNDGVVTSTTYSQGKDKAFTAPEGVDWVTSGARRFYKSGETFAMTTINVPTAGYYDVTLAYGSPVDFVGGVRINSAYTEESFTATGTTATKADYDAASVTVQIKKFSKNIYLTEGDNTIYLYVIPTVVSSCDDGTKVGDWTPVYTYNMLLEYSQDQDTIRDIVVAADFRNISANGGNLTSSPSDNFGWVPTGLGFLAGASYDGSYSVYFPADGYYNISAASCYWTSGTRMKGNVKFEDTTVISTQTLAPASTGSTVVDVVTSESFVATKGLHTITLDVTSGNSYFRGFKISFVEAATVYTVTAEGSEGGTATGTASVVAGGSVTLTATANSGYMFEGWYEGSALVSTDATFVVSNVAADKTYTAKFIPYVIINPRSCTLHEDDTPNDYLYTHWTSAPNYVGMTWGKGSGSTLIGYHNATAAYTDSISTTLAVTKDGFYDVYLAAGTKDEAYAKAIVGNYTAEGAIQATGAPTSVMENNIGRVYVANGDTFTLHIRPNTSGYLYLYDIMLKWSDDQTPLPVILNGKDMKFIGTGTYTSTGSSHNATTNTSDWAISEGMGVMFASNGVRLQSTVNVVKSGWYSLTGAYGTSQTDADLLVVVNNTSANLYSATPSTGARATVGEVSMGNIYLEAGETYTFDTYVQANYGGWSYTLYGLKLEYMSNAPSEVIINGVLVMDGSTSTETNMFKYIPSDNSVSWAGMGATRIDGAGANAIYDIYVPSTGYYNVNVASGTFCGSTPMVTLLVNGNTEVTATRLNAPLSDLSNDLMDVSETVIARVYLNEGENTIQINGVSQSSNQRIYNIKLEREDLPESYDVRIVDAGYNELSTVTGGSRIFAEVALPESVTGAQVFLAQYAGSGDEKTLVKTSYVGEAGSAIYSANSLNFYRTSLITDAVAGSVKAFLWTVDAKYIPLAAFDVASVN